MATEPSRDNDLEAIREMVRQRLFEPVDLPWRIYGKDRRANSGSA